MKYWGGNLITHYFHQVASQKGFRWRQCVSHNSLSSPLGQHCTSLETMPPFFIIYLYTCIIMYSLTLYCFVLSHYRMYVSVMTVLNRHQVHYHRTIIIPFRRLNVGLNWYLNIIIFHSLWGLDCSHSHLIKYSSEIYKTGAENWLIVGPI